MNTDNEREAFERQFADEMGGCDWSNSATIESYVQFCRGWQARGEYERGKVTGDVVERVVDFGDVLVEQHQGDCIQRINIPNARLVKASLSAMPQMPSEDELIKPIKMAMDEYYEGDPTTFSGLRVERHIARALLKHMRGEK